MPVHILKEESRTQKYSCSTPLYLLWRSDCHRYASSALSLFSFFQPATRRESYETKNERDRNQQSRNGGGDCNTDLDRINNGDVAERARCAVHLSLLLN